MNIKEIKELSQIMIDADLTAAEIIEGDTTVRLERNTPFGMVASQMNGGASSIGIIGGTDGPTAVFASNEESPAPQAEREGTDVLAPTVGVFYSAPSPDSEPFVKVGSQVKKGDVLCIIEAMKLMNEITAEMDGKIVQVYAGNGQVVEYDQPLFRIV